MNIKEMTNDDIQNHISKIIQDMISIRSQIAKAKCEKFYDKDWLIKAQDALRYKGKLHQELQIELKRKKKEKYEINQITFERAFFNLSKNRIDPILFKEIIYDANKIINNE